MCVMHHRHPLQLPAVACSIAGRTVRITSPPPSISASLSCRIERHALSHSRHSHKARPACYGYTHIRVTGTICANASF